MFRVYIFILILTSMCFSQQKDTLTDQNLTKGEQLTRKAKDTAGLTPSMTSFQLKLKKFSQLKSAQGIDLTINTQEEITISSDNKIRILSEFKNGGSSRTIWNEKKLRTTSEFEDSNGQMRVVDTTNGIQLSQDALKVINSKKPITKTKDSKVIGFSESLWGLVFPIILRHPIESSAKFEYLGRAQAGDQIADIVQTISVNGHNIQLFLDEKTSNLLLMIERFKIESSEFEIKYYCSNREERAGVSIPTKIKVEHVITPTGQAPTKFFEYIDLVSFEVNPVIKPEIFNVN